MAATAPTTFSEAAQSRVYEILSEGGYLVDKNGQSWYQYQTQGGKLAKATTPSFAQNNLGDVFHPDKAHQKLVITVDQAIIKQVMGSTTTNTPTPMSTGGTNSPNTS